MSTKLPNSSTKVARKLVPEDTDDQVIMEVREHLTQTPNAQEVLGTTGVERRNPSYVMILMILPIFA